MSFFDVLSRECLKMFSRLSPALTEICPEMRIYRCLLICRLKGPKRFTNVAKTKFRESARENSDEYVSRVVDKIIQVD